MLNPPLEMITKTQSKTKGINPKKKNMKNNQNNQIIQNNQHKHHYLKSQ
jgi:hypothetical protein